MKETENQRIKFLMSELGFKTQTDFAKALKIKQGSLSDIIREKPGVGVSNYIKDKLEILYSVNRIWIETGEGEIYLEKENSLKDGPRFMISDRQEPYDLKDIKDKLISCYEKSLRSQDKNIKLLEEVSRLKDQIIEAEREIRTMMSEEKNRKSAGTRVL